MTVSLQVTNICKSFGSVTVIDNVSLSIDARVRHLIIGPNGAGKTTFFNLLTGQLQATSGRIEIDGHDITRASVCRRALQGLGRTFQIASLFQELSVWDNILIAASAPEVRERSGSEENERASKALAFSQLEEKKHYRVKALSYGEQRRLEIALALATAPRILLLDEPLAGLTNSERNLVASRITELSATTGVVLIEHDLKVALPLAQRLTVLHLGKIIADGTADVVMNDPTVRKIYLG
jgi:ABC-type branched-subunit amino acid transport system ATPase component